MDEKAAASGVGGGGLMISTAPLGAAVDCVEIRRGGLRVLLISDSLSLKQGIDVLNRTSVVTPARLSGPL